MIFKFDDSQALQQFNQYNQRKDSQCSEVADLLNPMGRTSRISSVGSQGSAVSRLSGASGISRSPSPHKMLVETSFCGPKPIEPTSDASSIEHLTQDIENVILARRGDPTKVSLAEGVEMKPPTKTTKEKLQEIPVVTTMTPAEASRAAAKEERKREIEALKVRLNAINQRQLEKKKTVGGGVSGTTESSGKVKKVIGVTSEGTEYTRIKLKPDHLYDDKGMSPNEKIIEEKDFQDQFERKREHKKKEEPKKSPATDNRSPSPASASVSRKSSFCNFFKSNKEEGSSKSKPTSAGGGKSGSKLDKSPLPSPSKSSFSSRVAFSFFKTNRNASPSQLETPKQQTRPQQSTAQQQQQHSSKDKPKLRYYDAPDVIHIPLHTPPEEKEFSALKKKDEKKEEEDKIVPVTVHQPQQQQHQENQLQQSQQEPPKMSLPKRIAPTAQIEKMQSTDEIELHEIPEIPQYRQRGPPPPPPTSLPSKRKVSEDTIVTEGESSLWSIEVQRHSSQESQETVISSQPGKTIENGGIEKSPIPTYIDTIDENEVMSQQQQQQLNQQQRTRHKKHILFSTKIGSGSEEQIFSTQLSLSKTESQSSQLSEQASVFESPKNEECGMKMPENSLKHQSSSEIEKVVTATNVRSRSDHSDSGSGTGLQSITRNSRVQQRSSGEFSAKKRESSDELLHKSSPQGHQTPSYEHPQHPVVSLKQSDSTTKILQHQSSGGSRMEISSESDRESDIDGCIHKRVSRLMEDHESAGLVLQESFDDELPYVPTTLPEERSTCIKIIPMRERTQTELITIPVERPRSTTPINPTSLDNFCERKPIDIGETSLIRGEKLRISLPRHKAEQTKESVQQKAMTRRTSNLSNKSWTEFAEQGIQNTSANATPSSSLSKKKSEKQRKQSNSSQDEEQQQQLPPPPATVVKSHSKKSLTSKWIDFENIPEKRQAPKKITTLPMNKDTPSEKIHNSNKHSHHHHHQRQHFNYVSPEECQCECHEAKKDSSDGVTKRESASDDSQPLIDDNAERNSTIR